MTRGVKTLLAALIVVFASTLLGIVSFAPTVRAAAPTLTINELMYNPASDIDGDEFIELYNTTGAPLDISGCVLLKVSIAVLEPPPSCQLVVIS